MANQLEDVDSRVTLAIGVVLGWVLNTNQQKIKDGVKKVGNGIKKVLRLN